MPTKFAPLQERKQQETTIKHMKDVVANPVAWDKIQGKDNFLRQIQKEEKRLQTISPPKIDESRKDHVIGRIKQLQEVMIQGSEKYGIPPMPSEKEMWENPAGSTGKEISWQKSWKNYGVDEKGEVYRAEDGYGAVFQWKDAMRAAFPEREEDDPDLASIESFRPRDHKGESKLIDYRRWSMSPLAGLSHSKVDELFPDREPSDQELKVRAGELELERQRLQKYVEELENQLKAEQTAQSESQCQAVTAKGEQCERNTKQGLKHCGARSHAAQFPEG